MFVVWMTSIPPDCWNYPSTHTMVNGIKLSNTLIYIAVGFPKGCALITDKECLPDIHPARWTARNIVFSVDTW